MSVRIPSALHAASILRRFTRPLAWVSLVLLLVGALDPLEGSVLIAIGAVLAAAVAGAAGSRHRRLLVPAAGLVVIGVAALFGISALGGIGGDTGRSYWWALVFAPYPIGWLVSLAGAFQLVRDLRPAS